MSFRFSETITVEVVTCYLCGTPFGIESNLNRKLLATGEGFFCPNGHEQIYGNSTEKKLRQLQEQLKLEKMRADGWKEEAEIKAQELKTTRSELTRTKKKLSGGVCPCCHRQFVTLARHMKTKHPEYGQEENHD